ncbi:MAG: RsmB/NOP family class I SAM-dependent RNA methyltransferase [Hyphomicrobiales bacterium]
MRWGGRIAAAIEILEDVFQRHRPASDALAEWGRQHRFAGSKDRHAIGTLVFDSLRKRNSLAFALADSSPRSLAFGTVRILWGKPFGEVQSWAEEPHGPGALTPGELSQLAEPGKRDAPAWVEGDFPEWLAPSFERVFRTDAARQGAALAERAPVDLRVNVLKADRPKVLSALSRYGASEGPLSPWCVRIAPPGPEARNPAVEAEPAHGKGWYEVQDAGSQAAALMTAAKAGEQVADVCAGAGGKTLAIAAMMGNKGQVYAHDADRNRLRPIFDRLKRAGVRNVQVIGADEPAKLAGLRGGLDGVLIDAPCSGSGSWRRKPDAKWRLTDRQLSIRVSEQAAVLESAALLVKPGGRLVYVTCSVLPEENGDQIEGFLTAHPAFSVVPYREQWLAAIGTPPPVSADASEKTLLLTPANHSSDGFFIAILRRAP